MPPKQPGSCAASEALAGAHVPTLDPAPMNDAEIEKALGTAPCEFRYTSNGDTVLAWTPESGAARGVVKLNGNLVILTRSASPGRTLVLATEEVRATIAPDGDHQGAATGSQAEASVIFEVGDRLRTGYRGYYQCAE